MKRKSTYALVESRPTKKVTPLAVTQTINRIRSNQSSINQQAMRVGGWSNPSKGGELKFVDVNVSTADPLVNSSAFGTGVLLNGMASGSTAETRIGRKVTIKSLLFRWTWQLNTTSTGGSPARILIVYDKQANATAPTITDILLADANNSPNNLSNRDRFVTLADFITEPISANDCYGRMGVIYKKLNLEVMFNSGSAGTIGDITSGSIYVFVAQTAGIKTTGPIFSARSRIRYTDV